MRWRTAARCGWRLHPDGETRLRIADGDGAAAVEDRTRGVIRRRVDDVPVEAGRTSALWPRSSRPATPTAPSTMRGPRSMDVRHRRPDVGGCAHRRLAELGVEVTPAAGSDRPAGSVGVDGPAGLPGDRPLRGHPRLQGLRRRCRPGVVGHAGGCLSTGPGPRSSPREACRQLRGRRRDGDLQRGFAWLDHAVAPVRVRSASVRRPWPVASASALASLSPGRGRALVAAAT